METPIVRLGGFVLGGATLYDWELVSGSRPAERVYTITGVVGAPPTGTHTRLEAEQAEQAAGIAGLLSGLLGRPQVLEVNGPRRDLTVEQVYPLEIQPGEDPHTSRVRIADRRWLWPKRWVSLSCNLKRATGDKALFGENRIENRLLQDEVRYARWTLYPPESPAEPWTARTLLDHILSVELETPVEWRDEPATQVEVQDEVFEAEGPDAVDQALALLPGMDLYIDKAGIAVIYDTANGSELGVLEQLPALQQGGGDVRVADKRALRPSRVVVCFNPEVELRLDFVEDGGTSVEDANRMYNVAPSPDVETTIDGEVLARGSLVTLTKLFAAWGSFGYLDEPLSLSLMREFAMAEGPTSIDALWGNDPSRAFSAVNAARANAAKLTWRRMFRIDRFFTQRLAAVRASRASIINPVTGAYAPSKAYCDWIRRPSMLGFARVNDPNTNAGFFSRGYADRLEDAVEAPVHVSVPDPQLGLVVLEPQLAPDGTTADVTLGYPASGSIPSIDHGRANRTGQDLYARWPFVELADDFKLAVVVTVTPGSPNGLDRLHQVVVRSEQIDASLKAEGPTIYARVFPGVMTARFGWLDEKSDEIVGAIRGENDLPQDVLLNGDLVQDVAAATAARIYEALRDRPQGTALVDMRPEIEPTGSLSGVRHVMRSGACMTALTFSAIRQRADIWRWLSASTRAVILRTLDDPRGR